MKRHILFVMYVLTFWTLWNVREELTAGRSDLESLVAAREMTEPSPQQGQLKVAIVSPKTDEVFSGDFRLTVEVTTLYQLSAVTARAADREVVLSFNPCIYTIVRTCVSGYDGTISLAGIGYGRYQLTVTARDVVGGTGSAQSWFTVDRPPVLRMASPVAGAVASPGVRLEVTCEDDDPVPCGEMTVSYGSTVILRQNPPISTELSLGQFQGRSDPLCVRVADTLTGGEACRQVFVEASPRLRVVANFDGVIRDVREDRVLVSSRPGEPEVLRIHALSTGAERESVRVGSGQVVELFYNLTPTFPYSLQTAFLTDTGVVAAIDGYPAGELGIVEWRNGQLRVIGRRVEKRPVMLRGKYLIWNGLEAPGSSSNLSGLLLRDLVAGTTSLISGNSSPWQYDVGSDGTAAYWAGNQINRYNNGQSAAISGFGASVPLTDSGAIVYQIGNGSILWTPKGEVQLGFPTLNISSNIYRYFLIGNGRVAFSRAGPTGGSQVWVRTIVTGEEVQQHFLAADSYPDSLSPAGQTTFIILKNSLITETKRYVSVGGRAEEVGSALGKPFWVGDRLCIAIGGTLFEYALRTLPVTPSPPPTLTTISPTSAVSGSGGLRLTVTGTGFTPNSVVRWNTLDRPTTFVSATQIVAAIPASDVASEGTATVTVQVPESGGLVTSPARFTIEPNPRIVRLGSAGGVAGGRVSVPVELAAQGNEAAIGFSLSFDPAVLGSPQVVAGSDVATGSLSVNLAGVAQGELGVLVGLPSGQSLAAGIRRLAVVTFTAAAGATASGPLLTRVEFGDRPVTRELVDVQAKALSAAFSGTTIAIGHGLEGDVSPRPEGSGTLTASDWVLTGRLVAGIDQTSTQGEFIRADCAPRATLGDGSLSLGDWVQAARYTSQLDPLTIAGGPAVRGPASATAPEGEGPLSLVKSALPSRLRLVAVASGVWSLEMEAQGRENALAFSVRFDSRRWKFGKIETGRDAVAGTVVINEAEAARGSLGLMLAMPAGQPFPAGQRELLRITLNPLTNNDLTAMKITFADYPIRRELVGMAAENLEANYLVRYGSGDTTPATIVSAADYGGRELARGGIVSIFGEGLATGTAQASSLPLPVSLGGSRVEVTDTLGNTLPAQFFFASPGQLNLLLPEALAPGTATALITSESGGRSLAPIEVLDSAPAIFTANSDGRGVTAGLVLRVGRDGVARYSEVASFNPFEGRFIANPIDLAREDEQVFLVLFATGLRFRKGPSPVVVRVGSASLPALFAGPQGSFAGLDQVNVELPRNLRGSGETSLSLIVDGRESTPVRIILK